MNDKTQIKKEDIAGNPIYRQIARHTLSSLHNNLLKCLCKYFLTRKDKKNTLLVVGQGPEVVPFSRNLDILEEMLGNGCIGMIDYNPDILESSIDALINPRFDKDEIVPEQKQMGVLKRGYKFVNIGPDETIDLRELGEKVISVRYGDVSKPLKFADNSISALDATLVVHHATAYKQNLVNILKEFYRVLEKGGLLHYGEGNVNMRYQEEKIHRVATEAKRFYDKTVLLEDRRDPETNREDIVAAAVYEKDKDYIEVPLVGLDKYKELSQTIPDAIRMKVTKDGMIEIRSENSKGAPEFKKYLVSKGFKQVHAVDGQAVILPIIDPGMQEDRELHLEPVRWYYTNITALNSKLFANKPDIAAELFAAEQKEFGDASRGLIEYYTDPKILMSVMADVGFRRITYKPDDTGIWFNITAMKD